MTPTSQGIEKRHFQSAGYVQVNLYVQFLILELNTEKKIKCLGPQTA